jgi:hypothetical protein
MYLCAKGARDMMELAYKIVTDFRSALGNLHALKRPVGLP